MKQQTIYDNACENVKGFKKMGEEFIRKLVINNRARSTHENYLRQIAKLALYYNRTPLKIKIGELEDYLYHLIQKDTDSLSSYKHLVYGLRKLYFLFDKEQLTISLPSISRKTKLPVVLSVNEIARLLRHTERIREKSMFALTYDTGLRISEIINLQINDVDTERLKVLVRSTKNKKSRYICMSEHSAEFIKKHLVLNKPQNYVFESPIRKGIPISQTRIRALFKESLTKAKIKKKACLHTLRHSYATHQLEAGQNIMVLKDSLGHSNIQTTLLYLRVAEVNTKNRFGCLDLIYGK